MALVSFVMITITDPLNLNQQVTELLLQNKRIVRRLYILFFCSVLLTLTLALLLCGRTWWDVRTDSTGVLTLRGLAITDAAGKTRVRLQAPLPEPVIMGTHQKRDDSVSGVMLYDTKENERGGYVTDDSVGNAFLTLDSNVGQEVTLVAYPDGGAEFGINDDQKNKVTLQALRTGPRLRLVRSGKAVFDQGTVDGPKK